MATVSDIYLCLKNKVGEKTATDNLLLSETATSFTLLEEAYPGVKVSVDDITYDQGMYQPDHFTVMLSLTGSAELMTMSAVAEKLTGLPASIKYSLNKDDKPISDNLFVYQAIPIITSGSDAKKMSVRLEIYSADKLLDLQKFSQAFTGLPLGKILTNAEVGKFVPKHINANTEEKKVEPLFTLTTASNCQVLKYSLLDSKKSPVDHEIIQPYLAQYNETFHSLLNRTANRCGEFLYWHEDHLQYGLHDNANATITNIADEADSIEMSYAPTAQFEVLPVECNHRNGGDDPDFENNSEYNYDMETGCPDFNNSVGFVYGSGRSYSKTRNVGSTFGVKYYTKPTKDKDKYGSINHEKTDPWKFLVGTLFSGYAKTSNVIDFFVDTIVDSLACKPIANLKSCMDSDNEKQKVNHKRLLSDTKQDKFGFVNEEQTNFSTSITDGKFTGKGKDVQDYDRWEEEYKIAPFSTLGKIIPTDHNWLNSSVLSNAFYSKIHAKGEYAKHNAIDVKLKATASPVHIGQRIQVNSVNYIITKISGSCSSTNGFNAVLTCHAVPEIKVNNKPYFLPEPLEAQNRIMDGNSTAVITDTDDPYGQGRVRVRYLWQGAHPIVLSADDVKKCMNDALDKVYSGKDKAKQLDNDKNSFLLTYKDTFCKEILDKKKNDSTIQEKDKVLKDDDKLDVYEVNGRYYPKDVAEKKADEYHTEHPSELRPTPVQKQGFTYKNIKEVNDRVTKVDDLSKSNEKKRIAELRKEENLKDSTPWIRMSTPAAGTASFYMKPSVDDEVIVGFENGNPERPYVIGSLFNGSASCPGGFGISMKNGHGIKFEDEDMSKGDLAGAFISPITKSIINAADPDGNTSSGKKQFNIGGKVSIKDKYGFYSLSMSSADRAVSIKCPLGDISLSAFTGITISAPNGDINIKGKNVNITAGDRLTLTSGTNKDLVSSFEPTGLITKALTKVAVSTIDTFFGSLKAVDLSLARSVFEVMFRPLNGTLAINSKRHVLIQSGKGKVEMPVDAVQAKNPSHALSQFPNYPFYLMQNFMTGLGKEFDGKINALQRAYNEFRLIETRDPNNIVDIDNSPSMTDYTNATTGGSAVISEAKLLTELSKDKLLDILHDGLEVKNNIYVAKTDEQTVMKLCPFPKDASYESKRAQWKNLVLNAANRAACLKNVYQAIDKWKLSESPAVKTFIKVMNDMLDSGDTFTAVKGFGKNRLKKQTLQVSDFENLGKFISNVQVMELGVPGAVWADFHIDKCIGTSADLNYFKRYTFKGIENTVGLNRTNADDTLKHRVYYNLAKLMYKLDYITLIDSADTYSPDVKKYNLAKTFPEWSNTGNIASYTTWKNLLDHIVPAGSVEDKNAGKWSSFKDAAATVAKDTAKNLVEEVFDYDNISYFVNYERNGWDSKAHPGLILMSSENGSATAVLGKDGTLTRSDNYSVKGVLNAMKEKEVAAPPVTADKTIEAQYAEKWSVNI